MIILKVGGGEKINWEYIARDIKKTGKKYIVVHGANAGMKQISRQLGCQEKFITSPSGQVSRFTDAKTMEILTMVYSGLVNKRIVSVLAKAGIKAVGLTGADGAIWLGVRKKEILSRELGRTKVIRNSQTGKVISVNTDLLNSLLDLNYLPVLTIPAITSFGELINVDNDRAVAVMARDLKVKEIIMLFEAPGLLANAADVSSKIAKAEKENLDYYIKSTVGRMRKKILGAKEAFSYGVKKIYFADGRIVNPIQNALNGGGTIIS
jgi:acetylglutamate/LysW-gamma-L-alpha-aminoadipate kinase